MSSILLYVFCALLLAGALQDVLTLRISNLISVAAFVAALAFVALSVPPSAWWTHGLSFALILGGGILLFNWGFLGGGDVKLLAAASLWFDIWHIGQFLLIVALAGAVVTIVSIGVRALLPGERQGFRKARRSPVPYGVAIAAGAIWLAATTHPADEADPLMLASAAAGEKAVQGGPPAADR